MTIEETIFEVLSGSTELEEIFKGNIYPLTGKKSKLPALMYQIYQTDTENTKLSPSLKDLYLLKLHLFSEDYSDVVNSIGILKELLDFKEFTDDSDNIIIDLIRFESYTDDYEEKPELFNRTMTFSMHVYN